MTRSYRFKNTTSVGGSFSCKISKDVNELLTIYCRINNLNKTKFVNSAVREILDRKFESGLREERHTGGKTNDTV